MRKPDRAGRSARTASAERIVRCAIYTRKSTEEGLVQDFNSLDAQREACAAYILSQRHEGWTLVPDPYDDGGYSGGNMDRPAMKALIGEVAAGRIDVIVVYKVDRLTRSLSDFSRIVDVLDQAAASFVSVTQSFNTTTSMGRLTLNVLLSFAQFEREVTGERIRDKIAASKAKGMWMGGPIPLGYKLEERKLVIEPSEAELIRHIFARYLALGSGRLVVAELDRDGIRSKQRINRHGRVCGRQPISRGALYAILQNRLYVGEVVHKDQSYHGQHEAIIDPELFEQIQRAISASRVEQRIGGRAVAPSLLAGMMWDGHGRRMTPSHATSKAKRYRYYVSQVESDADRAAPVWRMPAAEIERLVLAETIAAVVQAKQQAIAGGRVSGGTIEMLEDRCSSTIASLNQDAPSKAREQLLELAERIELGEGSLRIILHLDSIDPQLGDQPVSREVGIGFARTSRQIKIAIPPPADHQQAPNASLLKLVAQAFAARAEMDRGGDFDEVTARVGCGREYLADLIRTSYLSPTLIGAIIAGRQPASLSRKQLIQTNRIPLAWPEQEQLFGVA